MSQRSNTSSPFNEKVEKAMNELFTMRNNIDGELTRADEEDVDGEELSSGNIMKRGDITKVLSEYRNRRQMEIEEERKAQRKAMRDALLSTPLPGDESGNQRSGEEAGGSYDPGRFIRGTGTDQNQFYMDYEANSHKPDAAVNINNTISSPVSDPDAIADHETVEEQKEVSAQQGDAVDEQFMDEASRLPPGWERQWSEEHQAHYYVDSNGYSSWDRPQTLGTTDSEDGDVGSQGSHTGNGSNASNVTPPPRSDFYQFVRSPKGGSSNASGGESNSNDSRKSDVDGQESLRNELPGLSNSKDPLGIDMALQQEGRVAGEGSQLSDMSEDADNGDLAVLGGSPTEDHGDEMHYNLPLDGGSFTSEPVMDTEAQENTLKNQAMLYESSQQLQLGGMVSSWALGGSQESLQNFNLGQKVRGSIEKLVDDEVNEMPRSVTFAAEDDVVEFNKEDEEGDNHCTTRGSQLERDEEVDLNDPKSSASPNGDGGKNISKRNDPFFIPPFNPDSPKEESPQKDWHSKTGPSPSFDFPVLNDFTPQGGDYAANDDIDENRVNDNSPQSDGELEEKINGLDGQKGIILDDDAVTEGTGDEDSSEKHNALGDPEVKRSQQSKSIKTRKKKAKKKKSTTPLTRSTERLELEPQQVLTGKGNEEKISTSSSPRPVIGPGRVSKEETKQNKQIKSVSKLTSSTNMKVHASNEEKSKAEPSNYQFGMGHRVEVNHENDHWSKGYVSHVHQNGTYDITFENGSVLLGCKGEAIRHETSVIDEIVPTSAPDTIIHQHENPLDLGSNSNSITIATPATNAGTNLFNVVVDHSGSDKSTSPQGAKGEGSKRKEESPSPERGGLTKSSVAFKSIASATQKGNTKSIADMSRFESLSRPLPDKSAKHITVPKAAIDCPNIPFDAIDDAQNSDIGESVQGVFSTKTDCIRIVLRAQVNNDEKFREVFQKLPKPKKQYGRSELKLFPDRFESLDPSSLVNALFGGNSRSWRLFENTDQKSQEDLAKKTSPTVGNSKHFVGSTVNSSLKTEMMDSGLDSAKNSGSILTGQPVGPYSTLHFLRRFSNGFACVAVDFYMNFLGTYDISSGVYMPGMNFDPKLAVKSKSCSEDVLSLNKAEMHGVHLGSKSKERPSVRQATVMEVDLTKLPSNVFALIPIVFDESDAIINSIDGRNAENSGKSPIRGDIPEVLRGMKFDCVLYSRESVNSKEYLAAEDDEENMRQASIVNEINGQEKAVTESLHSGQEPSDDAIRVLKRKEQERILKKHLISVSGSAPSTAQSKSFSDGEANEHLWKKTMNLLYERKSNKDEKLARRGSIVQITNNIIKAMPLGLREAFCPFVIYRRSLSEKGWAWKSLKTVTKGLQSHDMDHVLNTALEGMVTMRVLPFHAVHIEHCDNCEDHAMTTKHKPGHYLQYFKGLANSLQKQIPQVISQNNLNSMLENSRTRRGRKSIKEPRVGSFEVIMRPYCSPVSQLIYSKLATHAFPHLSDLTNVMTGYLHPKPISFDRPLVLDIILYGTNSRRPVADLEVSVYLIDVSLKSVAVIDRETSKDSNLKVLNEDDDRDSDSDEDQENDTKEEDVSDVGTGVPNLNPTATTMKAKKTFTKSTSFQLQTRNQLQKKSSLRNLAHSVIHDPAFSALGSWGRRDVLAWLESHGVSQDTKFFAEAAGVVNGAALVTLVNAKNLKAWGCANKRIVSSVLRDIERMKNSISHDHPSNVGLSNHRIHHMVETSKMMSRSMDINNSVAPKSGEFLVEDMMQSETRKYIEKVTEARKAPSKSLSKLQGMTSEKIVNHAEARKLGRHVNLVEVARGNTSTIGMVRCSLEKVGSYLVKASSGSYTTMWSHVLQVGADAENRHILWASKISPKMGVIRARMSKLAVDSIWSMGDYKRNGVMIPFTNIHTLKQHVLYCDFSNDETSEIVVTEAFFPVGRYFCNVTAQVVDVIDSLRGRMERSGEGKLESLRVNESTVDFLDCEEKMLCWHNRVCHWAAKSLQGMRGYLKKLHAKRLTRRMGLGIRIRMVMRGYLKRARQRLLPLRVTRIQSAWRRYYHRKLYLEEKRRREKRALIALYHRRKNAKAHWNFCIVCVKMFIKLRKQNIHRRLIRQKLAVLKLQCCWRRKKAYMLLNFQRKLRACSNQSLFVFKTMLLMKVLRRRRIKAIQKQDRWQESHNNDVMIREEAYMRDYMQQQEESDRIQIQREERLIRENLRQLNMRKIALELKRTQAATAIQAWARACDVRNWQDLYIAKSRGIIKTVYGGRPFRRFMYASSSEASSEEEDSESVSMMSINDEQSFVERTKRRLHNSYHGAKKKLARKLSKFMQRRFKANLEAARKASVYTRSPIDIRRQSLHGHFLPGMADDSSSDEDSVTPPPSPPPTFLQKYFNRSSIISSEAKKRFADTKAKMENKIKEVYSKAKGAIVAIPGVVVAPVTNAAISATGVLLSGGKYVGLAGVRHLRKARKTIAATQLPSKEDIKMKAIKAIQNTVDLPKKTIVRSGLVRLKSKDMRYMTSAQRMVHAITIVQSSYRGYKTRRDLLKDKVYRDNLAAVIRLAEEEKEKRLKAEAAAAIAAQNAAAAAALLQEQLLAYKEEELTPRSKEIAIKNRQEEVGNEATNKSKNASTVKSLKKISAKGVSSIVNGAGALVAKTGEVIKDVTLRARKQADEWAMQKNESLARERRRATSMVGLNDALLQIAGTLTHCPSLDRQWHIGIYPKGAVISKGLIGSLRGANLAGADKRYYSNYVDRNVEDFVDSALLANASTNFIRSGDKEENSRSINGYPLNKQTFANMTFFSHLIDIHRYDELEIVIFVETLGITYTPPVGTVPNAPFDSSDSAALNANNFFYAPAFYAPICLNGGAAFPPSGGRMHVKLRPNPSVISRLPKAKQFLAMDGLGVVVSLMPVAMPPSTFLRTFHGYHKPAPCYPSSFVDAILLEGCSIGWPTRNGPAISTGTFRDRFFVAASNRGSSPGVFEYGGKGVCIGQINEFGADKLGDVTKIVSGMKHIACCSTNGVIMVAESIRKKNSAAHQWGKPLFLVNHESRQPIVAACTTTHADMDVLFTADRSGNICMIIIDSGKCIRNFQNDALIYPAKVTSMVCNANRLYIGVADGSMVVISLYEVFVKGEINRGASLEDAILSREGCFHEDAGLTCLATVSPNRLLNFQDEDEAVKELGDPKEYSKGKSKKIKGSCMLEGHLVFAGGGDADPTVKVLQPQARGIRLLTTLVGHTQGISSILVDAAARYIFTASYLDRKIIVWDGLTFKSERIFTDLYITDVALTENALVVACNRAPYVRFWSVRESDHVRDDSTALTLPSEAPLTSYDLEKQRLHHEAANLHIATIRDFNWCHGKLRNIASNPPSKHSLERAHNLKLDSSQNISVLKRWLTQYFRVESLPNVYPGFLRDERGGEKTTENAKKDKPDSGFTRAKARRLESSIRQANQTLQNSLPGSPQHRKASSFLDRIGSPTSDSDSSPEQSPATIMRKYIDSKMKSSFVPALLPEDSSEEEALSTLSPKSRSSGNPTMKKGGPLFNNARRAPMFSSDDEMSIKSSEEGDDGDNDEQFNRLFPGVSKEKQEENQRASIEFAGRDSAFNKRMRKQHRSNNHAHFSDSDEEGDSRIKYLKPKKMTKAEIRAMHAQTAAKAREWIRDVPSSSQKGTVAVIQSPEDPKRPEKQTLEIFYAEDDTEDAEKKAGDLARYWYGAAIRNRKQREGNFFEPLVTNLRDLDIDSD